MLSDAIIIMIIGSSTAIIGLCLKLSYNSKCSHIKFCGLSVDRNTSQEVSVNISASPTAN